MDCSWRGSNSTVGSIARLNIEARSHVSIGDITRLTPLQVQVLPNSLLMGTVVDSHHYTPKFFPRGMLTLPVSARQTAVPVFVLS